MAKRTIGLDIKSKAVKLVEIEQDEKSRLITGWSIDYSDTDGIEEKLSKILMASKQKNRLEAKEAVISLSGDQVVYKLVDTPFLPEKEIPSAVRFKLSGILPFSIDDAVISYYKVTVKEQKDKQFYFTCTVSKKYLVKLVEEAKKAGITVKDIAPMSCALRSLALKQDTDPCVVIDIGQFSSTIGLFKDGMIVFCRDTKIGADNITHSMIGTLLSGSQRIDIDYAKAEEIKNTYGIPVDSEDFTAKTGLPASEVLAMMRPSLEKIGAEILRTFEYYRTETGDETQFKTMFISGGGSMTKGLADYLAQELSISVKNLNVEIKSKRPDFEKNSAFLCAATGTVLAGKNLLSLLPEEYSNPVRVFIKKYLNQYTYSAAFASVMGLILFGFWAYSMNIDNEYRLTLAKYKAMGLEKISETPEGPYSGYNLPGTSDKLITVIRELERMTPRNIRFQKIVYNRQSSFAQMSGIALDSDENSFSDFIRLLKESPVFASVDLMFIRDASSVRRDAKEFELKTNIEK